MGKRVKARPVPEPVPLAVELPTPDRPAVVVRGDAVAVLSAVPEASVDLVLTDPPYCSGGFTETERTSSDCQGLRSEAIRDGRFEWFGGDNMTTAGVCDLMRRVAVAADRAVKPEGSFICFCDWRLFEHLSPAMQSAGWRLRNLLVWNKGSIGLGTGFRPQHELLIHLTRLSPRFYAHDLGNVLDAKRVRSQERDHPTEKPVSLLRDLIRVASPPGGIVLDPFCGSGSTLRAALSLGRLAVGGDKAAGYVDVSAERLDLGARPASLFGAPDDDAQAAAR